VGHRSAGHTGRPVRAAGRLGRPAVRALPALRMSPADACNRHLTNVPSALAEHQRRARRGGDARDGERLLYPQRHGLGQLRHRGAHVRGRTRGRGQVLVGLSAEGVRGCGSERDDGCGYVRPPSA
jgi:hypothetical protein